jgi:uncharacterized membrane protein
LEPIDHEVSSPEDRKRGLDRIVNFSDAVVSIAATLLVLPLVTIAAANGSNNIGALLVDNRGKFLVFLLSFVVIFRFWLVHHGIFEHVIDYTPALIWVNFVWLLSIVFLPFPTQIIGTAGSKGPLVFVLYIGTMLVTTAATTVGQWIIIRTPKLHSDTLTTDRIIPPLIFMAAMAVALLVAVFVPLIGAWALLVLFPANWITKLVTRKSSAR